MTGLGPVAISQFTTRHNSFEADIRDYAMAGINAIDVVEAKMSKDPRKAARQAKMIVEAGLTPIGFTPRVHALFPDSLNPSPVRPNARAARFRASLEFVAESWPGADVPIVTVTGRAPGLNFRRATHVALEAYSELADYAGGLGLRIMLEPLSPVLMNTDTFICTCARALKFVRQVNNPNFGLLIDLWHVWDEPGIAECLLEAEGSIFGVQVSDWPKGEPRCFGDRVLPGDGVIDFPSLVASLRKAGYAGTYSVEIFSDDTLARSLWRLPAPRLLQLIKTAMAEVI